MLPAGEAGSAAAPYNAMLYSISGNVKAVQGGKAPKVLSTAGAVRWQRFAALEAALGPLTLAEMEAAWRQWLAGRLGLQGVGTPPG